jgi:hypothetical protein
VPAATGSKIWRGCWSEDDDVAGLLGALGVRQLVLVEEEVGDDDEDVLGAVLDGRGGDLRLGGG